MLLDMELSAMAARAGRKAAPANRCAAVVGRRASTGGQNVDKR